MSHATARHTAGEASLYRPRQQRPYRGVGSSLVNRPLVGYEAPAVRARRNSQMMASRKHLVGTGIVLLVWGVSMWALEASVHQDFFTEGARSYLLEIAVGLGLILPWGPSERQTSSASDL